MLTTKAPLCQDPTQTDLTNLGALSSERVRHYERGTPPTVSVDARFPARPLRSQNGLETRTSSGTLTPPPYPLHMAVGSNGASQSSQMHRYSPQTPAVWLYCSTDRFSCGKRRCRSQQSRSSLPLKRDAQGRFTTQMPRRSEKSMLGGQRLLSACVWAAGAASRPLASSVWRRRSIMFEGTSTSESGGGTCLEG